MDNSQTQAIADATAKKLSNKKPNWFLAHERSDLKEFGNIKSTLAAQDEVFETQGDLLQKQHDRLEELIKKQEDYHEKTLPVFEYLNEITVAKKIRSDYLKATGVWTGVILGVSAVGGVIWAIFRFLVFNVK